MKLKLAEEVVFFARLKGVAEWHGCTARLNGATEWSC